MRTAIHNPSHITRIICALVTSYWLLVTFTSPVHAAISSTTASIDTTTMTKNASIQMWFSIQNTDSQTIRYIKITRPSSAVTIVGGGTSWGMAQDESTITLTGGTLSPGANTDVRVDVESGSSEMSATAWIVQVSDSADGTDLFSASGDLNFSVSGDAPDNTPPNIANVSLSTTNSSFTVTWTTDEAANGVLSYGTTNSYGSTKEATSFTRNHSLTATALSQDSTYYFRIDSADASGNNANSYESFLVTSDVQPTATPTVTPTPTSVPGATPTPTPLPDKTEPLLIVHDVSQSAYKTPPAIKVTVSDESGIETVSYAVNGGVYTRVPGIGSSTAKPIDFTFTPKHATGSGAYSVKVKATDRVGNAVVSDPVRYTLDSTGPSILLATSFKPIMSSAPKLIGTVVDPSGVASIEYSFTSQTTWKSLASIVTDRGIEFNTDLPDADREGSYTLILRATDGVGNTSLSKQYTYAIDRIAPRAGLVVVKTGSLILSPDDSMRLSGFIGRDYTLYVPTTGGVMRGAIIVTTPDGKADRIPLTPSFRFGLWEATFSPTAASDYAMSVELDDGIRAAVVVPLFTFQLDSPSCVTDQDMNTLSDVSVSIYSYDSLQQAFLPWKSDAFGQKNPAQTPCYSWLLPKGTYRMKAQSSGYTILDTSSFTVSQSAFVSEPLKLSKSRCFTIWRFSFCSPWHDQVEIHPQSVTSKTSSNEDSVHIALPKSPSTIAELLRDKAADIVIMNTWIPDSMGIVMRLALESKKTNTPLIVLMPYESDSYVQSWREEAQITIPVLSDKDGDVIEALNRHNGPFIVHVSADGFVQSINVHLDQIDPKGIQ